MSPLQVCRHNLQVPERNFVQQSEVQQAEGGIMGRLPCRASRAPNPVVTESVAHCIGWNGVSQQAATGLLANSVAPNPLLTNSVAPDHSLINSVAPNPSLVNSAPNLAHELVPEITTSVGWGQQTQGARGCFRGRVIEELQMCADQYEDVSDVTSEWAQTFDASTVFGGGDF